MTAALVPEGLMWRHVGTAELYYDYKGAKKPEYAELPMKYWSKARILAYAKECKHIKDSAYEVLSKMGAEDLRSNALHYVGTAVTGKLDEYSRAEDAVIKWRHTRFYGLDVVNINSLCP